MAVSDSHLKKIEVNIQLYFMFPEDFNSSVLSFVPNLLITALDCLYITFGQRILGMLTKTQVPKYNLLNKSIKC